MLAISTTILFLGLYISTASTTPIVTNSSLLAPRRVPINNLCPGGDLEWSRRECVPSVMMKQWREVCHGPQYIYSSCPALTMCDDIVDGDGDRTIQCIRFEKEGSTSPRSKESDPQIGTSEKKTAGASSKVSQFDYVVTIANDMSASVAAVFLSNDHTWFVKTKNNIVGTIRGEKTKVCEGNPECVPNGNYDFKKGEKIDFTWGLSGGQKGSLAYTIWPST